MSYGYATPAPAPTGGGGRPAVVTIASALILVTSLCSLVYLIVSIAGVGPMTDAFEEVFAGTDVEGTAGLLAAFTAITGGVYFLFGVTLAILTIFNNKGRNGARIATWVVGGIGACCGGGQLVSLALGDATTTNVQGDGTQNVPDQEEIAQIIEEHVPGWHEPVLMATTVLGVLTLGAALILLALPPSNDFFRRTREQRQYGDQPPPPPPQYPPYPQGGQQPPPPQNPPPQGGQQPPPPQQPPQNPPYPQG